MRKHAASSILKMLIGSMLVIAFLFNWSGCFASGDAPSNDEELTLFVDREKELKVLQFADLHFGEEGTAYHNADVERTLDFIDYAIKSENPDFIVLLGDNMMTQGVEGAEFIVEVFDKYAIPYTLVYGNHDATSYLSCFTKRDVSNYLESCDSSYLLYKSGYVQADAENRYGNFSISVRDKSTNDLIGAFMLLDTGTYDYDLEQYQSINEGQIAWYKEEIARLNGIYRSQETNALDTVPTITYGHMQLPEYAEAFSKAKNNDGAEFVYYQELSDRFLGAIGSASGVKNYGFYDAMRDMGSAKAYVCGHMHGLTCHVKMDDIILGFCPQSGVGNTAKKTITTFSYTIDMNFDMRLNLVTEP